MAVTRLPGRIDLLALQARNPARYPLLLESTAFEAQRGRFDLLLGLPRQGLILGRDLLTRDLSDQLVPGSFPDVLDAAWRSAASGQSARAPELPFAGGWALFLAYEFAAALEPVPALPAEPASLPLALALQCPAAIVVDRVRGETLLVVEDGAEHLLPDLRADVAACVTTLPDTAAMPAPRAVAEAAAEDYLAAVARAREYIAAGDVFQVNLSRRWELELDPRSTPAAAFAALRRSNPAPFAGVFLHADWAVVSSSPERLVAVRAGGIETRPIAGTRPRLAGDDDATRIGELLGHPKERAEHIMLIDLERNDLGRVCLPGSIEVDELMGVESYAHVHHIVSNVRGRLRPDATPGAILRAVFPGGSITGCPKVRCMQIIAELEGEGRGAYTGSFGWLGHDGDMDLNILIRSLVMHDGRAQLRAGAGIVADSQPEAELAETRAKARGVLRAFGLDG